MISTETDAEAVEVLVVDDVRDNLIALEALLARPDTSVLTAGSGREALELMLEHEIAVAVIDVHMPGMDGFELAELMRGSPRTAHVPIIFVTAEPHDRKRLFRGYEAGAVDFLTKPIEPHVIGGKIDVFTRLFRQQRELSQQVERLQEALELNEKFVAVLGHDLRTPLNAISMGAALIRDVSNESLTRTNAGRVLRSSTRMARMIDHLLLFARARSGQTLLIRPHTVDLEALVESALEDCEERQSERVAFEVMGDVTGSWDPDRLHQVAANLIANALRHGDSDGRVRILLDGRDHDEVCLIVANDGVIPHDVLPRIFEPFRSSAGSLGLGLYIVRRFAEAHGGRVEVRSSSSEGTRFCVRLPRHADPVETS